MKRLKQAWKRDRLGVLGVGSAVLALITFALPRQGLTYGFYNFCEGQNNFYSVLRVFVFDFHWGVNCSSGDFFWWGFGEDWLNSWEGRLPIIGAFIALALILLLLRRR